MENAKSKVENSWFYVKGGERIGPVLEAEIVRFIKSSVIGRGCPMWKAGFSEWIKVEETELSVHLNTSAPPPLSGEHVSNTIVWTLAFAPVLGLFLEYVIAGAKYGDSPFADIAASSNEFWYVTLILNIVLSYIDEQRLKKAGHDTSQLKGWIWLIPVYLFQRAKNMKQSQAYFIVWICCFAVRLLS